MNPSFVNLFVVMVAAVAAPFLLGLVPRFRLSVIVLEILLGIIIGPSGLHVATVDSTVSALALLGLAFLLFLAGPRLLLIRWGSSLLLLCSALPYRYA